MGSGAPFKNFASMRDEWALKNRYISPGKLQSTNCIIGYGLAFLYWSCIVNIYVKCDRGLIELKGFCINSRLV